MSVQSMTGFARSETRWNGARFVWEIRSVNGKGLDVRMRLPQGFEALEVAARKAVSDAFARGNMQVTLQAGEGAQAIEAVVNEEALEAVIGLVEKLGDRIDARKPTLDGILNIRGILELREPELEAGQRADRDKAILNGLDEAIKALVAMREREGAEMVRVLSGQVDRIAELADAVENSPARSQEAIRARLAEQVANLLDAHQSLDMDRIHMEAAILATKADLREEIDRLKAHVGAVRELLAEGGPVGRRLDFLAQEFNRETNTICSKSNAAQVTAIGLDLKVLIDQFREQIQNLE
ncbi:YicC family protein [Pseudohoeflea suaedae]|uniref:YicC family protein n=1 Tax=Pseudohoeflea suaedae TaxID=877384 RepID=A0A4R5PQH8_9HYPH|nr:YicC/YloC family endoribonuclease [Pseudohoeflea suaedae]TDH38887.1 YicC family protein [Pseudohoeflea suaedae]